MQEYIEHLTQQLEEKEIKIENLQKLENPEVEKQSNQNELEDMILFI